MKPTLYFLYGPPAAGKLTVAKALSSEIGVNLFHNHLTLDLVSTIYDRWSPKFFEYCAELRLDAFKRAMSESKSLIFTFCYNYPDDDEFVKDTIASVEAMGGDIKFIKLVVRDETLMARVANEGRHRYEKIKDTEELKNFLTKYDCHSTILHKNSVEINTDKIKPSEAVKRIIGDIAQSVEQ